MEKRRFPRRKKCATDVCNVIRKESFRPDTQHFRPAAVCVAVLCEIVFFLTAAQAERIKTQYYTHFPNRSNFIPYQIYDRPCCTS